jgi:hypothetical protein
MGKMPTLFVGQITMNALEENGYTRHWRGSCGHPATRGDFGGFRPLEPRRASAFRTVFILELSTIFTGFRSAVRSNLSAGRSPCSSSGCRTAPECPDGQKLGD